MRVLHRASWRLCLCLSHVDIRFSKGICAFSSLWPRPGLVYKEEPWPLLFTAEDLLEEVRVKEGNERGGRPGRGLRAGWNCTRLPIPPRPWEGGEMRGAALGWGEGGGVFGEDSVGDI